MGLVAPAGMMVCLRASAVVHSLQLPAQGMPPAVKMLPISLPAPSMGQVGLTVYTQAYCLSGHWVGVRIDLAHGVAAITNWEM